MTYHIYSNRLRQIHIKQPFITRIDFWIFRICNHKTAFVILAGKTHRVHAAALLWRFRQDNRAWQCGLQPVACDKPCRIGLHTKRLFGKNKSSIFQNPLLERCVFYRMCNVKTRCNNGYCSSVGIKATLMRRFVTAQSKATDYNITFFRIFIS